MDPDAKRRADQLAEARALQSSFKASGSHRGENSPGGRGGSKGRSRGGGSGGGGGRGGGGGGGGGGRGGYHNVASDYDPPPSRRPQPSPLSRPPPGVPPPVAFGGSRQSSATRPAPTRTQVPAAPIFAPDPMFASALGAARPATAQAPAKAHTQVSTLTPAQVRDQFAAIVGGQVAPKTSVQVAAMAPAQVATKVAAQVASKAPAKVPAQVPTQVPAQVAAHIATKASVQAAPIAPAKVPAQVTAKINADGRKRCDRIATKLTAVIDAQATRKGSLQVAPMAPVQTTPNFDSEDMADQEMERIIREMGEDARREKQQAETTAKKRLLAQAVANVPAQISSNVPTQVSIEPPTEVLTLASASTGNRGPLKPPAVRGVPQIPEQPASFHGHNGVSNSRVKPSAAPDNDGDSVTQAKIAPIDSCIEHAPSITGSLPGPRSTETPARAESSRPIATSRNVTAGAPVVIYYQDEPLRPVVKRSVASSDATAGILHQQEEPPHSKPKDNTPAAPGNPLFKGYYQGVDFCVPVASSDTTARTLHQQEPPRPKPKDNTLAAFNGYYQDDDFLAKLPVTSSETPTIASYQNGTHHANVNSPSDMMDTTPDEPQTIPANQSDNVLQSQVVQSSDTKIQPGKICYPDDYDRPSAGGRASGADLMDVDKKPAIGGYPVLETANTQHATGNKCICPKKTTAGLGTSRWATPAVKETDPISVTCPVHRPSLRVALLTPSTPSFPPTASSLSPTSLSFSPTTSSLSPTASSFVPRSENSYNPPSDFQAASASAENVLNGHTNDDTSGSVRPTRLPGLNLPWFL